VKPGQATLPEGEGPAADRNFVRGLLAAGLHASLDSFYRTARGERQHRPGVIPLDLLPRRCPLCRDDTIIGHSAGPLQSSSQRGRRLRQCHDDQRRAVWVRRGICRPCKQTFTALPDYLAPSGHYSLHCRRQSCNRIAAEEAAPHCKDATRLPDPSTVRRWAHLRLLSVWCWVKTGARSEHFFQSPTILAWDLGAFCRILPIEVRSP
jgi:Domain of unknown function (DUF6431)